LPLLAVGLVIGVIVSLVQVLTSIQDPGFSAVPRLIAFLGAAVVFLPWITARLMTYTSALLSDFTRYCR
jgi:flagellar biosynthetic protein FliQ